MQRPPETPAVLIDETIAERNIRDAQDRFDGLGVALRPHIKTHKLIHFARMQVEAGAKGITCQKTSEAEIFADAGFGDILITYNIIGAEKCERLRRMARKAKVKVVADSAQVIAGLSDAFANEAPLTVLVECDTGGGRCGVQSTAEAAALAKRIAESPGLVFGGLMTYPAPDSQERVEAFLREAKAACLAAGLACETISSGGTPSMKQFPQGSVVTEYRPGTYIYNDRSLIERGACALEDCALTVVATVVSRPTLGRAIIDAGSKALSSDLLGMTGYGILRDYPEARITGLSEEHGTVDVSACARKPQIGEIVAIIPNHACVVTNLFDAVFLTRDGENPRKVPVDARGLVF
jgi:D-serine deaminase-like pyridoxal phosphate-dependent protein